jgi:hypothetical protein
METSLVECIPLASAAALPISFGFLCSMQLNLRLLCNNQFIKLGRSVLVVTLVAQDGSETPLNHLLSDVAEDQLASCSRTHLFWLP